MAKSNLNTQAKRKRELAKKDKRAAKDEKRALRKAEARAARDAAAGVSPTGPTPSAQPQSVAAPQPALTRPSSIAAAAFIRRMKVQPS